MDCDRKNSTGLKNGTKGNQKTHRNGIALLPNTQAMNSRGKAEKGIQPYLEESPGSSVLSFEGAQVDSYISRGTQANSCRL